MYYCFPLKTSADILNREKEVVKLETKRRAKRKLYWRTPVSKPQHPFLYLPFLTEPLQVSVLGKA